MTQNEILIQTKNKSMSSRKAYKLLYQKPKRSKKAHFVKIRIKVPNEKFANGLLSFLFFIPLPIFIVKLVLNFAKLGETDIEFSKSEIKQIISYRGIDIKVNASDQTKVHIKTI